MTVHIAFGNMDLIQEDHIAGIHRCHALSEGYLLLLIPAGMNPFDILWGKVHGDEAVPDGCEGVTAAVKAFQSQLQLIQVQGGLLQDGATKKVFGGSADDKAGNLDIRKTV